MQLNTSAVLAINLATAVQQIFKKQSTIYKMSFNTTLMQQAMEFRAAYDVPNGTDLLEMQANLIAEEYLEFLHAHDHECRESTLKELSDLVYVCYQYAANLGWDLDEAVQRVHESNMSKLGEDGKPIYREDGKVLKGPNYQPPHLIDLV